MSLDFPLSVARPARLALALMMAAGVAFSLPALAVDGGKVEVSKPAAELPGPGYAWVAMPAQTKGESAAEVQDPKFRENLQGALDQALQAKGYRSVPNSQADILVAYRVGIRKEELMVMRGDAPADTPQAAIECKSDGCSRLVVRDESGSTVLKSHRSTQTEGGLMLEVIDPKDIRVLWRATGDGLVTRKDAQRKQLDAIASQLLADLPTAE